jgi:hypothetical protein
MESVETERWPVMGIRATCYVLRCARLRYWRDRCFSQVGTSCFLQWIPEPLQVPIIGSTADFLKYYSCGPLLSLRARQRGRAFTFKKDTPRSISPSVLKNFAYPDSTLWPSSAVLRSVRNCRTINFSLYHKFWDIECDLQQICLIEYSPRGG